MAVASADYGMFNRPFFGSMLALLLALLLASAPAQASGTFRFLTTSVPNGTTNGKYFAKLMTANAAGPVEFAVVAGALPTGLSLDPLTGVIDGKPTVVEQPSVTISADDGTSTIQLVIDKFKISAAGGGGNSGASFGAALPDGLVLDQDTGVVSGAPTVAGTFYVSITATDNGTNATISLSLPLWIAPHAASDFYWDYFGVPAALYGTPYQSSYPILVSAMNGNSVTYTAIGLPPGITYNSSTGELSGTPSEVGVFPVIYTATDRPSGEVLTLAHDFIVLPPGGGDVSRLAVNLWIKKLTAKVNADAASAPNDSWQAQYIYNADRRTGKIFNPVTQEMYFRLGTSEVTIPAAPDTLNAIRATKKRPAGRFF